MTIGIGCILFGLVIYMCLLVFYFQSTLDEATDRWGIKVERVEM